jgi:O-antigen biosynthesis protein
VIPMQKKLAVWTEKWQAPEARLKRIEGDLRSRGVPVQRGGEYDDWDLEIQGGFWGRARLLMAVEDHGAGTQYVRYRVRPKCSAGGVILSLMLALLSAGAGLDGAWLICLVLGSGALVSIYQTIRNCGGACAVILQGISVDAVQTAADVLTAGLA